MASYHPSFYPSRPQILVDQGYSFKTSMERETECDVKEMLCSLRYVFSFFLATLLIVLCAALVRGSSIPMSRISTQLMQLFR